MPAGHSAARRRELVHEVKLDGFRGRKRLLPDILGLRLFMEEPPVALVFETDGISLRFGMEEELPPAHGTLFGWEIPEIQQRGAATYLAELASVLAVYTAAIRLSKKLKGRYLVASRRNAATFGLLSALVEVGSIVLENGWSSAIRSPSVRF